MTAPSTRNGRAVKSNIAATQAAAATATQAVKETAEDIVDDMSTRADEAASVLRKTANAAKDTAKALGQDVTARVADTAADLRDRAGGRAADARDALTDAGDKLAETLRHAADSDRVPQMPARVLSTAADGVSYATNNLRGTTLDDITGSLRGAAQRNPGLFVAGAALAGFAVARFLMTSRDHSDRT